MSLVRQILENASHVSSLFLFKDIAHQKKCRKGHRNWPQVSEGAKCLTKIIVKPCTGRRWVIEDCTFPWFKNFLRQSTSSLSTLCLFCCQLCHYFCGKQWQNCPVRRRIANSLELLLCTLLKSADLFYAYSYIRWKNQAHSITRLCHRQPTKKLTSSW